VLTRLPLWDACSTAYFEGVADIEANTSKELTKLGAVIQVPFRHGNQFLGEGGVQVSRHTRPGLHACMTRIIFGAGD